MGFATNCPSVIIQQQYQQSQIYRTVNTISSNDIFTVFPYTSIVTLLIRCIDCWRPCGIFGMWMLSFRLKHKCHLTFARREHCGLTLWEALMPNYSSKSYYEAFPQEPLEWCHSGCSGVAPLSLVVSVSGNNSPKVQRNAGKVPGKCWLEWLMFSSSLCNQHVL